MLTIKLEPYYKTFDQFRKLAIYILQMKKLCKEMGILVKKLCSTGLNLFAQKIIFNVLFITKGSCKLSTYAKYKQGLLNYVNIASNYCLSTTASN